MLRLTLLLDEAMCGFADLAVLGVIGNCAGGGFRPKAVTLPITESISFAPVDTCGGRSVNTQRP